LVLPLLLKAELVGEKEVQVSQDLLSIPERLEKPLVLPLLLKAELVGEQEV
jgi:hypothetical protein